MPTYPRELGTFDGEKKDFTTKAFEESAGGRCYMKADMDIDVDGEGPSHGDPYYQPDTTLHYDGKPLNSDLVPFIVLPPGCIKGVAGIVLGCRARVSYRGRFITAVVGDVGPTRKVGEASWAVAKALGIPPSPINGGVDNAEVLYEWWPGEAAVIAGKTYKLQKYGA